MKQRLLQLTLAASIVSPIAATSQNVFPSNGNAGIGTTSPQAKLHIHAPRGTNLVRLSVTEQAQEWLNITSVPEDGEGTGFSFQTRLWNNSQYETKNSMYLAPSGNVGMGTTTPFFGHKLEVYDGAHATIASKGPEAGFSILDASGVNAWIWAMRQDIGGTNNDLKLMRYNSEGYKGIALQIDNLNGNVGIGTTTPQSKLHVAGGARFGWFSINEPVSNWPYGYESIALTQPGLNFRQYALGSIVFHAAGNNGGQMAIHGDQVAIGTRLNVASKVSCTTLELTSDPKQKQDFKAVSTSDVLAKVASMPITTWAYTNSPTVRHLGPMSTHFKEAFGLGEDDKHIGAGDGIGVALAAIKGLHELVQEKDSEIAALKRQVVAMSQELASVKDSVTHRLAALEKAVSKRNVQQASFLPEAAR